MVEFLGDLDIEARVRVFEDDVLLRLEQRAGVEPLARAALGERVDVGPFRCARAARGRVPFLAQALVERLVGE